MSLVSLGEKTSTSVYVAMVLHTVVFLSELPGKDISNFLQISPWLLSS